MAEGLLDKANIILTPTGYKAGTMYNVAPIEQPYEDFVFSRASVASRVNSSGLIEMVGRTLGSNLVQNGDFSEIGTDLVQNGTFDLGSELVTNGDFATDSDWILSSESNIINGELVIDALDGSFQYAQQDFNTIVGETYKVQFDITEINDVGKIQLLYGTLLIGLPEYTSVGTHTLYFTSVSSSDTFTIKRKFPSSTKVTIDNVSVKEVPDWTLGTGWSVEDNKAEFNGTTAAISQNIGLSSGKSYKIAFTLDVNKGGIAPVLGGSVQLNTITTSGNHTVYGASGVNPLLYFQPVNFGGQDFQGSVTNIVVQELDPNDYWNLETGWSLGDEEAICNGVGINSLQQSGITTTGKTYKLIFDVISKSNDDFLVISTNFGDTYVNGSSTIVGTNTFYINPSGGTGIRFRVANGTSLTITNVIVQEVIDTNNIPRINYDSNGENGHWLLEPTSTNEITYSEDFSQSDWSKTDVLIENGYTAPDGSNTAYKITSNGANAHLKGYFNINTNKRKSIWAKTVSGSGDVYLLNANGINLFSLTNEWQRFDITHSGVNNFFYAVDFRGASTTLSEVIIWGCQLEDLSYATSYIPTLTGSTETRATETATGAGSDDLINSTEGVLYAEIAALANDGTNRTIALNKDTNDRIQMYFNTSTNGLSIFYKAQSGATAFIINETLTDATLFNKIAFKWKTNDFALWVNGVETDTVSSGVTPTANSLNALEFDMFNNASPFYGKCKELTVFGEALSDDELEKLTSWSSFNAMATDLGYTIE